LPPAGAVPGASWAELVQFITTNVTAQRLTHAQVQATIEPMGFPSLPMVGQRPDMVPQVFAALRALVPV
jgi:hypothetical protein